MTRFKRSAERPDHPVGASPSGGAGTGAVSRRQNSLHAANGLAVSPDGESDLRDGMTGPTVNGGAGAVTRFARHADGTVGYKGCFADRGKYDCHKPSLDSLGSPESMAISPDGASLYVGSYGRTLSIFEREVAAP